MSHLNSRWWVAVALLISCGCASEQLFEPAKVASQHEAGSVHVAVLSVAPFEAYKAALQPKFEMTEQDALANAINPSMVFEEKVLDAMSARLKVSAGGSTSSTTEERAKQPGEEESYKYTKKTDNYGGDPSRVDYGQAAAPDNWQQRAPHRPVADTIKEDPMLAYWAATALYQEVKLLNMYVKEAAIAKDSQAYVVRLQVTILPTRRDLSYDTYTNLSFFSGAFGGERVKSIAGEPQAEVKTLGDPTILDSAVTVLPLLVTDNLEAAVQSRSLDRIRKLALAVSAASGSGGVGGDFQKANERLQNVLGRELNSTLTLGSLSPNTIRCRFGAQYSSKTEYAMVPQTHNVTLLLVVPSEQGTDGSAAVHLVARSWMADARSGELLDTRDRAQTIADARDTAARTGLPANLTDSNLMVLMRHVAANDFGQFAAEVKKLDPTGQALNTSYLFAEFVNIRSRNAFASAAFAVSKPEPGWSSKLARRVIVADNGQNTVVTAVGGANLDNLALGAALTFPQANGPLLTVPTTTIELIDSGRVVRAIFPSLSAMGAPPDGAGMKFSLLGTSTEIPQLPKDMECLVLRTPTAPVPLRVQPTFGIGGVSKTVIATREGTGAITANLALPDGVEANKVVLRCDGADIAGVESSIPGAAIQVGDEIVATCGRSPLSITIKLRNLNPSTPLVLIARDAAGRYAVPPMTVPVTVHP